MAPSYKELQARAKELGIEAIVGTSGVELQRMIKECEAEQAHGRTKSAQIRRLLDEGKEVKDIAKELGLNYAFVYGVGQRHRGTTEPKPQRETISEKVRQLHDQGLPRAAIRRELSLDYAFVHTIVKSYELRKRRQLDESVAGRISENVPGDGRQVPSSKDQDGAGDPQVRVKDDGGTVAQ